MPVKSKSKSKVKAKAKPKSKARTKAVSKAKKIVKAKPIRKSLSQPKPKPKSKAAVRKPKPANKKIKPAAKVVLKPVLRKSVSLKPVEKPVEVTRSINLTSQIRRPSKPAGKRAVRLGAANVNLFNFMKAPRPEYAFEVGDTVEVFCDHEKGRERVRGWIKGIVVQVDNKMVAVQFRSNVFLTDGWMVPDRILWYPLNSEHIRPVVTGGKKPLLKKDIIPDY